MTSGQIRWNKKQDNQAVTTTLIVTCTPRGQIHMETPPSQGGFSADYSNPQEASQGLVSLFEQGLQEAETALS